MGDEVAMADQRFSDIRRRVEAIPSPDWLLR
jgi:hypothetical protein